MSHEPECLATYDPSPFFHKPTEPYCSCEAIRAAYQRGREDAAKAVEAIHFPDPYCHTEPTYEADAQDMIGCGFCWDGEYRFDKWPCDSILAARGDGEQA